VRFERFTALLLLLCSLFVPVATAADRERILLPLLVPPVFGAHGSEFRTELTVHNTSDRVVALFGIREECEVCLPEDISGNGVELAPGATFRPRYDGTPGRFIEAAFGDFDLLAANLRVYDVSRDEQNFGTEIPIVRDHELTSAPIHLAGVPVDARFRNTLRIYGTKSATVRVTIGSKSTDLFLVAGPDEFDPAYAAFTDFTYIAPAPNQTPTVRITITPLHPGADPARIWAFVSVTNNATQMITTVTPPR
jgi:hypothetical protein